MSRKEKIYTLRIDEKLLTYLQQRADRNSRSIAKELEFIVKQLYLEESQELENIVKKVFAAYENEKSKNVDIKKLLEDDNIQSPLKEAALELVDFIKALN